MKTTQKRSLSDATHYDDGYRDGYVEALQHVLNILEGMGMLEKDVADVEKAMGYNLAVHHMTSQVEGLKRPSQTPGACNP
jgi:hypothetical protein